MIIKPSDGSVVTFAEEGQLAVDVMETNEEVIVAAPMAGARSEKIQVVVHNDLLTIRGVRPEPLSHLSGMVQLHSECFWGSFSRTIILPTHVNGDFARAEYKQGVLTVYLPKQRHDANIPIVIVEE